jgi:hypothetical protein
LLAGLEPVQDGYDNERGDQGDRAESDDKLSDEEEEITQAVPFKCIGAAHENHYQHHLEKAYLTLHEQDKPVNVRIRPEPLNPRDPSAIAIDLYYGAGWLHVGYILLLNYASISTHYLLQDLSWMSMFSISSIGLTFLK